MSPVGRPRLDGGGATYGLGVRASSPLQGLQGRHAHQGPPWGLVRQHALQAREGGEDLLVP